MAPNAPNVCCLEFYTKFAEPGGGVKRLPAGVASRGEEGPGRALLPGRRAILCWGLTWSRGGFLVYMGAGLRQALEQTRCSPRVYSFLSPGEGSEASRAQSLWVVG